MCWLNAVVRSVPGRSAYVTFIMEDGLHCEGQGVKGQRLASLLTQAQARHDAQRAVGFGHERRGCQVQGWRHHGRRHFGFARACCARFVLTRQFWQNAGSYGSLARFLDVQRIFAANRCTVVGGDGDISDLQAVEKRLRDLDIEDRMQDDGLFMGPRDMLTMLARMQYQRRTKLDPLWNNLVVAGWDEDSQKPVLGTSDKIGTLYEDDCVATSMGMHIALPILRAGWRADLDEQGARALVEQCMRVLFYRDTQTLNRIVVAKVSRGADGKADIKIDAPIVLKTEWKFDSFVRSKADEGSW